MNHFLSLFTEFKARCCQDIRKRTYESLTSKTMKEYFLTHPSDVNDLIQKKMEEKIGHRYTEIDPLYLYTNQNWFGQQLEFMEKEILEISREMKSWISDKEPQEIDFGSTIERRSTHPWIKKIFGIYLLGGNSLNNAIVAYLGLYILVDPGLSLVAGICVFLVNLFICGESIWGYTNRLPIKSGPIENSKICLNSYLFFQKIKKELATWVFLKGNFQSNIGIARSFVQVRWQEHLTFLSHYQKGYSNKISIGARLFYKLTQYLCCGWNIGTHIDIPNDFFSFSKIQRMSPDINQLVEKYFPNVLEKERKEYQGSVFKLLQFIRSHHFGLDMLRDIRSHTYKLEEYRYVFNQVTFPIVQEHRRQAFECLWDDILSQEIQIEDDLREEGAGYYKVLSGLNLELNHAAFLESFLEERRWERKERDRTLYMGSGEKWGVFLGRLISLTGLIGFCGINYYGIKVMPFSKGFTDFLLWIAIPSAIMLVIAFSGPKVIACCSFLMRWLLDFHGDLRSASGYRLPWNCIQYSIGKWSVIGGIPMGVCVVSLSMVSVQKIVEQDLMRWIISSTYGIFAMCVFIGYVISFILGHQNWFKKTYQQMRHPTSIPSWEKYCMLAGFSIGLITALCNMTTNFMGMTQVVSKEFVWGITVLSFFPNLIFSSLAITHWAKDKGEKIQCHSEFKIKESLLKKTFYEANASNYKEVFQQYILALKAEILLRRTEKMDEDVFIMK